MLRNRKSKTYKREVGFLLLAFLCYLAWAEKTQELEIMVLPTFAFVAMAFGMDWGSKQTELVRNRYGNPKATSEEAP